MVQVVGYLHCKHKNLSSNPSTAPPLQKFILYNYMNLPCTWKALRLLGGFTSNVLMLNINRTLLVAASLFSVFLPFLLSAHTHALIPLLVSEFKAIW
jgi:hypothetical protein